MAAHPKASNHLAEEWRRVVRQLFPKAASITPGILPARTWKPWKKPADPLAIDDKIGELISGGHLRSREELAASEIECPYYSARVCTVWAAIEAREQIDLLKFNKERIAPDLIKISKRAKELAKDLRDFESGSTSAVWSMSMRLPARPMQRQDENVARAEMDKLQEALKTVRQAAESLDFIGQHANSMRGEIIAPKGEIWDQAFIYRLGVLWLKLTGSPPKDGSLTFLGFVQQAYVSLHPDRKGEHSFSRPIRTLIAHVATWPEWDQWDRALDPPGVEVFPIEEAAAHRWVDETNSKRRLHAFFGKFMEE